MANSWLRLWHDMPNDPKWRSIARASKQSIPSVMAVYLHLLVNASNATERGRTQSVCNEDIASALDLEIDQIDAIIEAMQGRVLDGDLISGWSKRQVDREDGGAERARAWREAKKSKENGTQPNANERNQTPDKDKDKDKELKTNPMSLPAEKPLKADAVPYEEIKELYHQTLPMCPRVAMLTTKRKGQIAARWKSGVLPDLETWKQYFEFVSKSDFLTGKVDPSNGHKRMVANLEWLTNEANFVKVWEKTYHGK